MLTGVGGQPEMRHPLRAMSLNPLSTLIYTAEYKADIYAERDVKCLDFSQRKQLQNRLAFETGKTA